MGVLALLQEAALHKIIIAMVTDDNQCGSSRLKSKSVTGNLYEQPMHEQPIKRPM